MTKTNDAGILRRIWRNRPLRFTLIGVVCLLLPVGCIGVLIRLDPASPCGSTNPSVSDADLPGTYRGPDAMRISLHPNGRVDVKNWLYEPFQGDPRRIDGRGGWSYEVTEDTNGDPIPRIDLALDEAAPTDDALSETQHLYVGGTPEDPVLFVQDDPDSCPDAEFHR